ncbi:hypothetical protein [Candidatus Formimonas warabiya]|uniref:Uncharacterized protein n=1 Tax=Formimonas warabiya TaxID=1761012 RepID=A0A3G1KNY5_FORW1|nr:hypothetical protein [Candidatus Formimonas warabiya]ATW23825.1 hypothetical protein DCMF_02550 [Candidatus Formimonas warabiya]
MNRSYSSDLRTHFYRLMNDENYRNCFYRQMAPYRHLSENDLMTTIGSFSSKVPEAVKRRHLNHLAALTREKACQTKKARKRIDRINYTILNDPPYSFPYPYSYYDYQYRPFGGFLSALILLGLLGAIL